MIFFFRGVFYCSCLELLLLTSVILLHNNFPLLLIFDTFLSSPYHAYAILHFVLPLSCIS